MHERGHKPNRLVEDKDLARAMAYAEKPYREIAINAKKLDIPSNRRFSVVDTFDTLAYYASENVAIKADRGYSAEQIDLNNLKEERLTSAHNYIIFAANVVAAEIASTPCIYELYGADRLARSGTHYLTGGENILHPDIANMTVAEAYSNHTKELLDGKRSNELITVSYPDPALKHRIGLLYQMFGVHGEKTVSIFDSGEERIQLSKKDTNVGVELHQAETKNAIFLTAKYKPLKNDRPDGYEYYETIR